MIKYVINGGKPLYGSVTISGAKNAVLGIIPAALLVEGVCRIENVPRISDVSLWLDILNFLGAKIRFINPTTLEIDSTSLRQVEPNYDMMRKMRASYYLIGALLGRFGSARVAMPGGCDLGDRPIDQHIKGFQVLGAEIDVRSGIVHASLPSGLRSGHVYFDKVSVGATINVMLAAVRAPGLTVLENAAKEPHIVDVANFLNSMGADVRGAGTDVIKIRGVPKMRGGIYSIIPDQIEAGTFIAAVSATGGDITIDNIIPKHLECITAKFTEMGVTIIDKDDAMQIIRDKPIIRTNVKTLPYPGFPTDMQPQIAAVLCLANGTSVITESIWDNRFRYVDELRRMGAQIQVDGKTAVIDAVPSLTGAPVCACDLRAGAALVIAGLAAKGPTELTGVHHIERGYENLVEKLRMLGADISVIDTPDTESVFRVG